MTNLSYYTLAMFSEYIYSYITGKLVGLKKYKKPV